MKMRVMGFEEYGPPEVLKLMEQEVPEAGPGLVRVRVKAAGVQPADCAVRQGWRLPGARTELPAVPGNEFAGIVDRVGAGVSGFAPGDEVLGFRMLGCYAEYVVVPPEQLVRKPAGMPWEEAGSLSASGQTAHTAVELLRIAPGETVFVNGAAGGVGTIAVQLACGLGAAVIGSASPANHDYVRSLGAVPVAYGEGLADRLRALAPRIDAALDAAGGEGLEAAAELVRDRSRVGTIVAFERAEELGITPLRSMRSAERLAALADLYEAEKLKLHIRRSLPLEEAAEAHREVEKGHGRGKIVLRVAD